MKRANTMSTITVELIIKMKTKFTSSNAEKTNGFISPQMSHNFHTYVCLPSGLYKARTWQIAAQTGPEQEILPLSGMYFFDGWRVHPTLPISSNLPRTKKRQSGISLLLQFFWFLAGTARQPNCLTRHVGSFKASKISHPRGSLTLKLPYANSAKLAVY